MKLTGKDGQEIELKILGYEFPTHFDNEWDANWLRIYLKVKSNTGRWQTVHPSLLTDEVSRLITWFSDLSKNNNVESELDFIEPNISFQLLNKSADEKSIQVRFDLESRPQSGHGDKDYVVAFQFSNEALAIIAKDLSLELSQFPFRPFPSV